MVISCYGDSNTRFYLGDTQENGEAALAYPAVLGRLLGTRATVHNCGYPDMQTDFAVEHFAENVTALCADVCILGFGTNDIRQPDADLPGYLARMETLLRLCETNKVRALVLLIPWFSEGYCGAEGQARIPLWNEKLRALCDKHGAGVLDVYTAFCADPPRYFNETKTAKRHYSPAACEVLARMACEAL